MRERYFNTKNRPTRRRIAYNLSQMGDEFISFKGFSPKELEIINLRLAGAPKEVFTPLLERLAKGEK